MDRRRIRRPQHILVVDDSEDARVMWTAWLTFWGFTVDQARNGAEAVSKAQAHTPDLVLMDLWMPVMDGLAATSQLRNEPATANVPVLALSADNTPSTPGRARAAGCDEFLLKPVDPGALIEHLRRAFARVGGQPQETAVPET